MSLEAKIEALTAAVVALTAKIEGVAAPVATPAPVVIAPPPVAAPAPAPVTPPPAPAMPAAPSFIPAPVAATPTAPDAPFADPKGMLDYVMAAYKALGPTKGGQIQGILQGLGVSNINDVPKTAYGELFTKVEALKAGA